MKIVEKADATATLAEYIAEIANGAIIVTSEGRPVAALVPIENAGLETVSLSTNCEFLQLIERSRVRTIAEGTISSEEMRALLK
jgi:prevent-host-death family protein